MKLINKDDGTFVYDSGRYMALALTMKRLKSPFQVKEEDYLKVLAQWNHHFDIFIYEPYFERDDDGILHLHSIIVVPKNFYKKKLQTKDFYVYTTDLYYKEGWEKYISKVEKTKKIDNTVYMF